MAWNSSQNKILGNTGTKAYTIGPGAPVAQNPNLAGKAYRDQWDIEQAYRQGVQKVTWVARCIDAIAGNQARLPIVLRKNNSPDGEIVKNKRSKDSLLHILNSKSNIGENSFIFRYRLSSQLLMGTRGAFIEKVQGRDGRILGLNLLPPQSTAPIPHPKTFVSGYEVMMPDGTKIIMKPDQVVWIRRPHPLDPYLSLTPMESAGVAIEIENLAKLYNRNYLLNDGRPGGLLVVKGDIDDDDKMELRSRFRANLGTAGATTVIAADDGVDYVDTSASPRDAAYIQMRQITKEEILAAFGVPESVIGNAAGRTFANAGEEIRVFWSETMMPHLEHLARAFDILDDKHYVDFDISAVPSLALYEQERNRYVKEEFQTGLISANEYREASGRKIVHSELGDSLLQNPNLTPIGNTHKEMETPNAQMGGPGGAPPGMPPPGMPGAPQPGAPGAPAMPGMPPGPEQPLDPNTMQGALAAQPGQAAPGQMSGEPEAMSYKTMGQTSELERWTEILDRGLERLFERQQRVVLEKASGAKAKKALTDGTLDVDMIMSQDVWDKQVDEDIRPVLNAIVKDATETYSAKSENYKSLSPDDVASHVNSQMDRIKSINTSSRETIVDQILQSLKVKDPERRATTLRSALIGHFTHLLAKTRSQFATDEARRAWNLPSH